VCRWGSCPPDPGSPRAVPRQHPRPGGATSPYSQRLPSAAADGTTNKVTGASPSDSKGRPRYCNAGGGCGEAGSGRGGRPGGGRYHPGFRRLSVLRTRNARGLIAVGGVATNFPLRQGESPSSGEPAHTRGARKRPREARQRGQRTPPAPSHRCRRRRRVSMPPARRPAIGPPVIRRATPCGIAARPRQRRRARHPTATGSAAPNSPLRQGGSASREEPAHTRGARNRSREARRRGQRTPPAPGAAGPKPSSRARLLLGVLGRTDNLQTALGLCQGCFFPERAPKSSVRRDRCISTCKKRDTA